MSASSDPAHDSASPAPVLPVSLPARDVLLCWSCGYELTSVDLPRAGYRCPECGQHNIPGDPRVAPYSPRPWPRPWALVAGLLWPGACLAGAAAIPLVSSVMELMLLGGYLALLAFIVCIAWPLGLAELLILQRVPAVRRVRWLAILSLGGILGNLVLATALIAIARMASLL